MIQALDSALTAITSYEKKLDVTANNIANAQNDGFKRDRVTFSANAQGGVKAETQKVDEPGPQVGEQTADGYRVVEKSNVNLAEEMVNLITARHGVAANVAVAKTADEMVGMLLDIKK